MPVNGRLQWSELIEEIARRQSQFDIAGNIYPSGVPGTVDSPYYLRQDIENMLWEVSNAALRELTFDELQAVGLRAITSDAGASPLALPDNAIDVLSGNIGSQPAVEVLPSIFLQGSTRSTEYAFYGGNVNYVGTGTGTFQIIVEPPLSDWQANNIILPPGYDETRISDVCQLLEAEDFLPVGRI
jgi:hypothetical protein